MVTDRVSTLRNRIIQTVPHVSTERARFYTESMRATEIEPILLRHAKALVNVLHCMSVEIFPGELIVGTITEKVPGAAIYPEGIGMRVLPELEDLQERDSNPFIIAKEDIDFLAREIAPYWEHRAMSAYVEQITPTEIMDLLYTGAVFILTEMAGIGHVSINYPKLLSLGFDKVAEIADKKIIELEKEAVSNSQAKEKITFYKSAKIVAKGIIQFAERYAKEAENRAKTETNPKRKAELEGIAEICRHVPAKPPRTFHEALQFIHFTQLVLSMETYDGQAISMGRMDQYLYPYYERDMKHGQIEEEKAMELIECLWIKINEQVPLYDNMVALYFDGLLNTQAVTVSGIDKTAKDATNDLTYILIDATRRAGMAVPNVHVRIHKNSPRKLLEKLGKVVMSGTNNIAIFNDDIITKSLVRKNIPLEESRDYATVGCVELAPFGTSFTSSDAALFNLAICLDLALNNGESPCLGLELGPKTGDAKNFKSINDVITAFRTQLSYLVELMAEGSNCFERANMDLKPTPFLSLCVEDCFEKGVDITQGSARYNFTGVQGVGLADVADSLTAIDKLVFQEKRVSLMELLQALKKDFEGFEEMRQLLVNKAPKYGNDNESADKYAQLIARIYAEEVEKHQNARGGWFIPGMYSVTAHMPFGYMTGALPSGRRANEPLSNGSSPASWVMTEGPTAAINSVTKLDFSLYPNGTSFTISLDPTMVSREKGPDIIASMIETYANLGGMHIHFTVTDADTLIEAQNSPEEYRNLLVRVAGFSAYFVNMSPEAQNEIISRYQKCAQLGG